MARRLCKHTFAFGVVALLAGGITAVQAADGQYRIDLGPVAHDNSTRANVLGAGSATATLSGSTLSVKGHFEGLPSNATGARLVAGQTFGVPVPGTGAGPLAADAAKLAPTSLTTTDGTSGDLSGSVTLSADEMAALQNGGLYIVLTSVKAPNGNLWGWFQSRTSTH